MTPGPLGDRRYRLIAFDWDGTAVTSRAERPAALAETMERLLAAGVTLAVVTGGDAGEASGQIAPLLSAEAKLRLFVLAGRGAEVYGYTTDGELERLWARTASHDEETALDSVAAEVQERLRELYGVEVRIACERADRRRIDLLPGAGPAATDDAEALLASVRERVRPVPGGIPAVVELAYDLARAHGVPDASITSDVRHVDVALTDKSDSIAYLMRRLAPMRGIRAAEVLLVGDEFGPVAGLVEGSDYRMVTRLASGATIVSVGREPNGVPAGVLHLGGGPERFERLLADQLEPAPATTAPVAAAAPPPRMRPGGEGWTVVRTGYDPVSEASLEPLFALTNGYMGVRGSTDEPNPGSAPGAYVAGLFDGRELGDEDMVVIPDWTTVQIRVDGEPLQPWELPVERHERVLDLRDMTLSRTLVVRDAQGRRVRVETTRLLSLAQRHLGAVRLEIAVEGAPATVEVLAGMEANEQQGPLPHVEVLAAGSRQDVDMLHTRTPGARVHVDVAQAIAAHVGDERPASEARAEERFCGRAVEADLDAGATLVVDRFVAVHTERESRRPAADALALAAEARARGFEGVLADHAAAWEAAWHDADVVVEGDERAQVGVRFAIAQLVAVAPPREARTSVGAKGLTGGGYKGHVFWDTDVFLMPFYAFTMPDTAQAVLEYRVHHLPAARTRAELAGLRGAWYPWESAASGEDVTPPFVVGPGGRHLPVLTGHQEIHIVPDIAWASDFFARVTGRDAFLADGGGSMVVETARYCASRTVETERGFEIHHVIGPDEIHEDVDNSAYTNLMAAWTLRRAARLVEESGGDGLDVTPDEPARWRAVADRMVVCRTEDGLLEQHEGFLDLPIPGRGPHDRSELAWQRDRQQWRDVKQADVVMLMALLPDDFSEDEQRAHYRLYEPLTLHLSSLSEAVHSLVARRTGMDDEADRYLDRAIGIDLDDNRGNRSAGLHMATQGGIWQAVVAGAGGVAATDDRLRISPRLPASWTLLEYRVAYRGQRVGVTVRPDELAVEVLGDAPVPLAVPGWQGDARPGVPLRFARDGGGWRVAA